jgi:hypothetical protein
LIGLQAVVINKLNAEAARVNADGDRGAFDRLDQAMRLINEKIKALLDEYREEQALTDHTELRRISYGDPSYRPRIAGTVKRTRTQG